MPAPQGKDRETTGRPEGGDTCPDRCSPSGVARRRHHLEPGSHIWGRRQLSLVGDSGWYGKAADPGGAGSAEPIPVFLTPLDEYEIFLELVCQEVTVIETADH
jgi:hypothetical protein